MTVRYKAVSKAVFPARRILLYNLLENPADIVVFSGKPEIRLELKLEHRNISLIRLELDYRHFALISLIRQLELSSCPSLLTARANMNAFTIRTYFLSMMHLFKNKITNRVKLYNQVLKFVYFSMME